MARPWRRLRTARARSTFAATSVVAVVLILGGLAVLTAQRLALVDAIDTALVARVDDLSGLLSDGVVPSQLTMQSDDEALVQIIDESGAVVLASSNIDGEGRISGLRSAGDTSLVTSRILPVGDETFRLAVRTVVTNDQEYTVYAAAGLENANEAVTTLAAILVIGIPLLIGLVGATVWIIIGRTLHPVEAIREEVAWISDRQLDRRVPVPDSDDEIGRLAGTMNQMLERLEAASLQQRAFVADASHELRSPLAAIRAQLEVDLVHPEHADGEATNAEILEETLRMQRLVDDLLLLARSDSGTLSRITQAVDLDDLVFDQIARADAGTVTIDAGSVSGAQVDGNAEGLGRLVRNLLENAVRFARLRVEVGLAEDQGFAVLTISDDGPGISVVDRDRIFDRFTRVDEARDRDHGGAGLGLAIVKEITEHHRGSVSIDDGPLGGARFTVRLPTEPR